MYSVFSICTKNSLLVTMLVKEDNFKVVEYVTLRVNTNAKFVQL